MEYVGEVIDEKEQQRRLALYHKTGAPHMYIMEIGHGNVIDALEYGNQARFINHSCVPNCELQRWWVVAPCRYVCVFGVGPH